MIPATEPRQHMQALQVANFVKALRADLKADVIEGRVALADVLRDPPRCVQGVAIYKLLRWQDRWGRTRALRLLAAATCLAPPVCVNEMRRVGEMTERERYAIAGLLER